MGMPCLQVSVCTKFPTKCIGVEIEKRRVALAQVLEDNFDSFCKDKGIPRGESKVYVLISHVYIYTYHTYILEHIVLYNTPVDYTHTHTHTHTYTAMYCSCHCVCHCMCVTRVSLVCVTRCV